jgi:hypothetical protein
VLTLPPSGAMGSRLWPRKKELSVGGTGLPVEGGCRCGQVRLRISAPPLLTLPLHRLPAHDGQRLLVERGYPERRVPGDTGDSGDRRTPRAYASLLLPSLHELDVHARRGPGLVRQSPPDDARQRDGAHPSSRPTPRKSSPGPARLRSIGSLSSPRSGNTRDL